MNWRLYCYCRIKSRSLPAYQKMLEKSDCSLSNQLSVPCYPQTAPIGCKEQVLASYRKKEVFHLPEYNQLLHQYPLRETAGSGTVLEQSIRVMQWLTNHTYYCGMQTKLLPDDTLTLLKFSYNKRFSHALNCRDKTIVLTDCLLALGIRAMPLCFMSFTGCHLMTHVFLPERKQWVLLDPSFNVTFLNEAGCPMDVFAVQDALWNNKKIAYSGYNFNRKGRVVTKIYQGLFLKSILYWISTWPDNRRSNVDKHGQQNFFVMLEPEGANYLAEIKAGKAEDWTFIGKEELLSIDQ